VNRLDGLVAWIYEHQRQAERAVADLWEAGFAQDLVDMITRSQGHTEAAPNFSVQKKAADGAAAGALAGASAGAMAGAVATMMIPGLGTVIGGGLLAGILGGAALGAAGGTFLGPFFALEMANDEARYYAGQLEEGRTVVLVRAFERAAEARAILARHGGREGAVPPAAATLLGQA
jgi:hypothetical protein